MGKRRRERKSNRDINLSKSGRPSRGLTKNDLYPGNERIGKSGIAPNDHKLCEEDSRPIKTYEGHMRAEMASEINLSCKEHIIFVGLGIVGAILLYLASFLV